MIDIKKKNQEQSNGNNSYQPNSDGPQNTFQNNGQNGVIPDFNSNSTNSSYFSGQYSPPPQYSQQYTPPPQQSQQYSPPPQFNPQQGQQYNREYADESPKKKSSALTVILVGIIGFLFAVIVILSIFFIMNKGTGGDTDVNTPNGNPNLLENPEQTSETSNTSETLPPVTTAVQETSQDSVQTAIVQQTNAPVQQTVIQQVTVIVTQPVYVNSFIPYTYSIDNYSVAIYSSPSYQSSITGYINDRGTYTIVDESNGWGKLKSGAGWINFRDASDTGNFTYLGSGYVSTNSSGLNLRRAPAENASIVTEIPKNATIDVYSINADGWYYVQYGTYSGYASAGYITLNSSSWSIDYGSPQGYAFIATKSDPLNLRESPSTGSKILAEMPKGSRVEIINYYIDWCYVEYNGIYGYANTDFLDAYLY